MTFTDTIFYICATYGKHLYKRSGLCNWALTVIEGGGGGLNACPVGLGHLYRKLHVWQKEPKSARWIEGWFSSKVFIIVIFMMTYLHSRSLWVPPLSFLAKSVKGKNVINHFTMQQGLTFEKKTITKCSTLKIDFSANFHLTHIFFGGGSFNTP